MKKNEVRLFGMKIKANVGKFGLDLDEDREDCQVGTICRTDNGRFIIEERTWKPSPTEGERGTLSLVLARDNSNRKWRRQEKERVRAAKARK